VIDVRDREFHADLLKECRKARCMLLISGYQNDLYDELLSPKRGWTKSTIETHTRDTTGKDYARTETLWMNARYVEAQKSGTVPIRLTKKELKHRKINPSRKR
jgi:DNA adenine methylase